MRLRLVSSLRRPLSAVVVGTGAALFTATASQAQSKVSDQAASKRSIHEVSLRVSPKIDGDFAYWLPGYIKKLIELPGLLGAKVLRPEAPSTELPAVVFVLGGPGAGKGTQCAKIVDTYGYVHLSAGDLLRAERKSGSAQGKMIDEYIAEGKIVPVEITVKLLADAVDANGGKRFLIDGFPRNTNNLSGWHTACADRMHVAGVLVYDCPEEVMEARLLDRGKTSGRSDDNIDSIRKRFVTFKNETKPVLEYYENQGNMVTIDGTRDIDQVWTDTKEYISSLEAALVEMPSEYIVQLHANSSEYSTDLRERVAADAANRWGTKAVQVDVRSFRVDNSLKAFDLPSLRAFD